MTSPYPTQKTYMEYHHPEPFAKRTDYSFKLRKSNNFKSCQNVLQTLVVKDVSILIQIHHNYIMQSQS